MRLEDFNILLKYFEWTYLFFLFLSKGHRIHYLDALTYRIHKDTHASSSKSVAYEKGAAEVLQLVLALPLDNALRLALRRRYMHALNTRAVLALNQGQRAEAWMSHLQCLWFGGWRYGPFTRRLLWRTNLLTVESASLAPAMTGDTSL